MTSLPQRHAGRHFGLGRAARFSTALQRRSDECNADHGRRVTRSGDGADKLAAGQSVRPRGFLPLSVDGPRQRRRDAICCSHVAARGAVEAHSLLRPDPSLSGHPKLSEILFRADSRFFNIALPQKEGKQEYLLKWMFGTLLFCSDPEPADRKPCRLVCERQALEGAERPSIGRRVKLGRRPQCKAGWAIEGETKLNAADEARLRMGRVQRLGQGYAQATVRRQLGDI